MKKIIGFLITLVFVICLTGCKNKPTAQISNEVIGRSTYKCDVKVNDKDIVTAGSVIIKFYEISKSSDNQPVSIKTLTSFSGPVSADGLKSNTEYRADVLCTIEKKQQTIYSWNFKTIDKGTSYDPVVINTANELVENLAVDYSSDSYYVLGQDIDFASYVPEKDSSGKDKPFKGVCQTSSTAFAGSFDGKGFTIKNVTISTESSYSGFFGYVKGAIRNVNFENIDIAVTYKSSVSSYAGIVCGYGYDAKFNGVNIKNSKISTSGAKPYVGGLVGYAMSGSINNCDISGLELKSEGASDCAYVGGIAGYISPNSSSKYGTLFDSTVSGTIKVTNAYKLYYGGAVGYLKSGAKLERVVVNIDADLYSSDETYIGGLSGFVNFGSGSNVNVDAIKDVAVYGKIAYISSKAGARSENTNNLYIGGIIGSATAVELSGAYLNVSINADVKVSKEKALNVGTVFGCGYEFHTQLKNAIINSDVVVTTTDSDTDAIINVHKFDGSSNGSGTDEMDYTSNSVIDAIYTKLDVTLDAASLNISAPTETITLDLVEKANWDKEVWEVTVKDGNFVINFK